MNQRHVFSASRKSGCKHVTMISRKQLKTGRIKTCRTETTNMSDQGLFYFIIFILYRYLFMTSTDVSASAAVTWQTTLTFKHVLLRQISSTCIFHSSTIRLSWVLQPGNTCLLLHIPLEGLEADWMSGNGDVNSCLWDVPSPRRQVHATAKANGASPGNSR